MDPMGRILFVVSEEGKPTRYGLSWRTFGNPLEIDEALEWCQARKYGGERYFTNGFSEGDYGSMEKRHHFVVSEEEYQSYWKGVVS